MELIGALGSPDIKQKAGGESEEGRNLQGIVGEYTQDHDSRVRTSAFEALVSTLFLKITAHSNLNFFFLSVY